MGGVAREMAFLGDDHQTICLVPEVFNYLSSIGFDDPRAVRITHDSTAMRLSFSKDDEEKLPLRVICGRR